MFQGSRRAWRGHDPEKLQTFRISSCTEHIVTPSIDPATQGPPVSVILRSVVFNVLFYLNLSVQIIAALPTLVMPRRAIVEVARFWARTNLWLLRVVCGTRVEFRGLDKIPCGPAAGCLQASVAVGDLRADHACSAIRPTS